MQIEILSDPSCFESLEQEWCELLTHAVTNHIFITPQFQKSWWQTLGEGQLQVITVRGDTGQLVGIAPCFVFPNQRGEQQLSLVGCVNVSDYLDVVVDKLQADAVYTALLSTIDQHIAWDCLYFCSLPQYSPSIGHLQDYAQQHSWQLTQTQQDVCPVIDLPKTWEEYLDSIGKKQRHEIKRKWQKLLSETDAQFELIEHPHQLDPAVSDFIQLHQKSSVEKKNFWDEKHVAFFKQFATETSESGWLKLYFLCIHGKRVASMLGFEYNHQFFLYNSGFDADEYRHLSVGNVLTAYTIQQAIERGDQRYDFLRGNEEYKFRFRAVPEPIFDVEIKRPKK